MIKVKARGNESVEGMLRRFKKMCEKEGVTKDISEGGAYVCCATPLGPKAEICMVIYALDKQLNVKAEVVWANT